jgi:integrase/recombinase XerD
MLTIYRRHRKGCEHRREGRKYRRCRCPIWVDGFLGGREIRESLDTCDWQKAQDTVREWESLQLRPQNKTEPISIAQACENFLVDVRSRGLSDCTTYKYKLLFRRVEDFVNRRGIRYLMEIDLPILDQFRSEWKESPLSSLKKLERLKAFLRFCERRKWLETNPATYMKAPKVTNQPTLPFTREEMIKILAALDKYAKRAGSANAQRLRAFVLLLRYSGMRIGDAVQCGPERLKGNRLFLYTQKTGVPVQCVLPDFVVEAVEAAPKSSEHFFFWTGKSKLHTVVGVWQQSLQTLFTLAEVQSGHAHRFRDTFAIELLLTGVPLDRVSILLGHQSIRVTERHYAPWTRSRQEQLIADLERAWEEDPIALMQTKGTQEVHREAKQIN